MSEETRLDDNISLHQAASTSNIPETDTNTDPGKEQNEEDSRKSKEEEEGRKNSIPFYKLFSFADAMDIVLMVVGTVAAVGNGVAMPVMTIIFGQLVDSFGETTDASKMVQAISKVALRFVYLGIGAGVASFLQVSCWVVTGERQAARIRNLYLKIILRQDIAFFDKELNTGEVIGRMSGDTILIQDFKSRRVWLT